MVSRLEADIPNGDLPLWAKVTYRVGVPAVIALGLVYWLTGSISGDVKDTHRLLEQHISEQRFYLRAICVNTAKDDGQRATCIQSNGQ